MENKATIKKDALRSKTVFFILRNLIGFPVCKTVNFTYKRMKIKEQPFIIFSNHTDTIDPAFLVVSTRRHIRFVMSDHVTRIPKYKKILDFLNSPIIFRREKGTDELYNDIINTIKSGVSVAMYVEGGKTSTGETEFISPRNATLVKDCGCPLITYRVKGGYLKNPRWAKSKRKGPLFGEQVKIYSAEEIRNMSEDELYKHILDDLYINAYDEQRTEPHEYIGEDLAEHAEIILYGCPKCKAIGELRTKNDKIFCTCGFTSTVDTYGFWHSDDTDIDNIPDWDKFQKQLLRDITEKNKGTDNFIFRDTEQKIYEIENGDLALKAESGDISLFADRVEVKLSEEKTVRIPINTIKTVRTSSRMDILLVSDNYYFEIKSPFPRSATKYIVAIRYLQGKENK